MSTGALLLLGLLFGMQHATEADHLAAVATLVAREKQLGPAIRQGVFWGLGHSLTLLLFGGAVMVVGIVLSDRWIHALEGAVGIMLVLLGADLMRRLWRDRVHFHPHVHTATRRSRRHISMPTRTGARSRRTTRHGIATSIVAFHCARGWSAWCTVWPDPLRWCC